MFRLSSKSPIWICIQSESVDGFNSFFVLSLAAIHATEPIRILDVRNSKYQTDKAFKILVLVSCKYVHQVPDNLTLHLIEVKARYQLWFPDSGLEKCAQVWFVPIDGRKGILQGRQHGGFYSTNPH